MSAGRVDVQTIVPHEYRTKVMMYKQSVCMSTVPSCSVCVPVTSTVRVRCKTSLSRSHNDVWTHTHASPDAQTARCTLLLPILLEGLLTLTALL
jgi:hypothetical protein